jgi:hypothetical protein
VYKGAAILLYIDGAFSGSQVGRLDSAKMNTGRAYNFFGRSFDGHAANAMFDEIKLYNIALSKEQVKLDMSTASGIPYGLC